MFTPALNGKLGLFRLDESKGDEESIDKLPYNVVCQEKIKTLLLFPLQSDLVWDSFYLLTSEEEFQIFCDNIKLNILFGKHVWNKTFSDLFVTFF